MYVQRPCSVFSGATPLAADWAEQMRERYVYPLALALEQANQVWRDMSLRPDLDDRGQPRAASEQPPAPLGSARSTAARLASRVCVAVRKPQEQTIPPPAEPALLPPVTLEAAELCDGLTRGTIRPEEIAADKLAECAAAGYVGAARTAAPKPVEDVCSRLRRGELVTYQGQAALETGKFSREFIHRCEELMYNEPGTEAEKRACSEVGLYGNFAPCPPLTAEQPQQGLSGLGQAGPAVSGGMKLLAFGVAALLLGPTMLKAIRERD